VQQHLSAYLDRELSGDVILEVRAHLSECAVCEAEERELRSLKQLLGGLEAPEPPADFAQRLTAAVIRDRQPEAPRRRSLRAGFLTFAGVAACSMAFTFLVLSGSRPAPVSAGAKQEDLAFEVQRDQAYAVGWDATSGAPMFSSTNYGR